MATKRRILVQLDNDAHPSVFDRVVAIDAGVEELFSYGNIEPDAVEALVHGAIFTRGPADLKNTAIFVGGKNVTRAEEIFVAVQRAYLGAFRTSVMLDPNGANTTAAAAVLTASHHLDLARTKALVLGGTGPVGQRVALLLARQKAAVWVSSRSKDRAQDVCNAITEKVPDAKVFSTAESHTEGNSNHPEHFNLVVSAAAAGVRTISRAQLTGGEMLKVVMDLNAVPPLGIEGVQITDNGREENGIKYFGAIGVGGLKMKIHKASVASLFHSNDQTLDAEQIFDIGQRLEVA
ncbi:bifunctional NADP-dependent methylenetetrahydromethanopterin dehydrogenase/methylenetetrahydrofolate dehydrogenase [bacterium]|nr:bifunctional NADP-dependent methylenetetrahydromethanopterin dehydrogenase/methylenetetrahydrofolate dehydrogenase [bacterium]